MKRDDNPARLLTSSAAEDDALRAMLRAGKEELPDAQQLAALVTKLGPIVGGPGGGGSGGGTTGGTGGGTAGHVGALGAKSAMHAAGTKLLALVVAGTVVSAGAWYVAKSRPAPTHPSMEMSGSAAALPSVTAIASPMPSADIAPSAPIPSASASAKPDLRPRTAAPLPSPNPASDPDREVQLLQAAQDALASDPTRTLSVCTEHARRFPQGLLAQEREVLAVDALVRLGRSEEARARGTRFAAMYPSSTQRHRIEELLQGAP